MSVADFKEILPIFLLWNLIGLMLFIYKYGDDILDGSEINVLQMGFISLLTGQVSFVLFISVVIYRILGRIGKIFKI